MSDIDPDRFCASLRTAIEHRRETLAPDEMAGNPRVGRLISEIDTLETIIAAVTEATGGELKKAIADRDLKPENIQHPMQPIVMVEGVARFKQNAIVRYLLDWATARGLSLNQIACMPHTKDDYQHLMQLIGYSVSGYGDLNEHDPKVCADADALVDAALKDTDEDEAPLDLRSPMQPQGVTAGFADYIQALKRINSFKGMGEPLNFEYQAGPILLADRVETMVKEHIEMRMQLDQMLPPSEGSWGIEFRNGSYFQKLWSSNGGPFATAYHFPTERAANEFMARHSWMMINGAMAKKP